MIGTGVMEILRAELPALKVIIHRPGLADLAAGLTHGRCALCLHAPKQASGLKFRLCETTRLIVLTRRPPLNCSDSIRPQDIRGAGHTFIECPPPGTALGMLSTTPQPSAGTHHHADNLAGDFAGGVHTEALVCVRFYFSNLLAENRLPADERGAPRRSTWSSAITRPTHRHS